MRRAAAFLEGWIDHDGVLLSYSYDLDQVYREMDGVAMASVFSAFQKLGQLEKVSGNNQESQHAASVADRIGKAMEKHFLNKQTGYYCEHLIYNDIARSSTKSAEVISVSSELDDQHKAIKAIDGITGMGIDAFGVGIGAAGNHEWAAKNETTGAWIRIGFKKETQISRVILTNRTGLEVLPGERFRHGLLQFSDGSPDVDVEFNSLSISRAIVSFEPRAVKWIQFTGTEMVGDGGSNAGLAEIIVLPEAKPYIQKTHGMTDTNLAAVAFGVAGDARAKTIWDYFRKNESSFYEVNGLRAPTWISEKAESYGKGDLNRRAPYKDNVAIARIWRYDALMRRRMDDGEGIVRTIQYANTLYDRPSGGGIGLFSERYGLGKFQPGDEAQATVPAYAGYPAIYNSTIVQEVLLGINADVSGTISINPCVPLSWYEKGFGQDGCGIHRDHDLGFRYYADRMEGWLDGHAGKQVLTVRLPPELQDQSVTVEVAGKGKEYSQDGRLLTFTLSLPGSGRVKFRIRKK